MVCGTNPAEPRTVLSAPVTDSSELADVLYLALPSSEAAPDLPDYVQAVARQILFVEKGLLLSRERSRLQELDAELRQARAIQMGLAPKPGCAVAGIDLAFHYEPAAWVGGDYCDYWGLPDGRLALAIGDVCGKGLPAAMVMSSLHTALRMSTAGGLSVTDTMRRVDEHLSRHVPQGRFVTMLLGALDSQTGELEYVNAGHPQPLLIACAGTVSAVGCPRNLPLGLGAAGFVGEGLRLERGGTLVAVTDGITEAASDKELFGTDRLTALLQGKQDRSPEEIVRGVAAAAADFRQGLPQHDDVTILAVRYLGAAAPRESDHAS